MHEKEVGFVLKRFLPSTHKISLLTQSMGKVNVIVKKPNILQRIWPGMVVSCQLELLFEATYTCEDIEIIEIPPVLTAHDTYLIHHLLELCYYFIPLANPCSEVFDHLFFSFSIFLNKQLFIHNFDIIKRILILRLLHFSGTFSSELCGNTTLFDRISPHSLDIKDEQKVESVSLLIEEVHKIGVKTVDRLIFNCIKTHPSFKLLKTVPFLYEGKIS